MSVDAELTNIELRYQRSLADPYDPETCENALRDVPALVKALREAMCSIGELAQAANLPYDKDERRIVKLLRERNSADSVGRGNENHLADQVTPKPAPPSSSTRVEETEKGK